ncbi:MAG: sugar ABC transporter permease [Actinomycetaceae bacterium]|nr:sugar ABC transporter permease [Actinomycetaceae bacterium]MDY6083573.1 sugar ABC transporter permease [Actinomycetaceae bacterium]
MTVKKDAQSALVDVEVGEPQRRDTPGQVPSQAEFAVPSRWARFKESLRLADRHSWRVALLLLAPNVILLVVFVYRPLIDNIRLSFTNWNISSPSADWVGLANYERYFSSASSRTILWNTVIFTAATVVGAMILGLIMALVLDQKLRGRNVVRSIVFAPYIISGAAVGIAFQFIFEPTFGLIADIGRRNGFTTPNFYQEPHWALFMVIVTYIWKTFGYAFVIYLAALQGRRLDLDEAAQIDGASPAKHLFKVVLPQLRPTTFFLSITMLLSSMQVFDLINVMTRGGPEGIGTTTMVYQIYQETFMNASAGYGATVATVLFVILLAVTLLQVRAMQKGEQR